MLLRDIIDLDATYGAGASDTASDQELEIDVVSEPADGADEDCKATKLFVMDTRPGARTLLLHSRPRTTPEGASTGVLQIFRPGNRMDV